MGSLLIEAFLSTFLRKSDWIRVTGVLVPSSLKSDTGPSEYENDLRSLSDPWLDLRDGYGTWLCSLAFSFWVAGELKDSVGLRLSFLRFGEPVAIYLISLSYLAEAVNEAEEVRHLSLRVYALYAE